MAEVLPVPSSECTARRMPSFTETGHVRNAFNAVPDTNDFGAAKGELSLKPTLKIMAWLAGATLLVVMGVSVSLWTFNQIEEAANVRKHTFAVINNATGFLSALSVAESAQRGFILSGDEAYLESYLAQRDDIRNQLKMLRQSTLLPAASKHLATLTPMVSVVLTS